MKPTSHRAVVLRHRPEGVPVASDFDIVREELPGVSAGDLVCRARFLSLDPYLRGVIAGRHLGHTLELGQVIPGACVAQVTHSHDERYSEGDWVVFEGGWRERCVVNANSVRRIEDTAPSTALGVLGMPGLTAWAGITKLAKVRAGDTVLISAAAGPVGATAGQIAKILGARVVGIAGGAEKCARVIRHFGFDDCVDYKSLRFQHDLRAACPNSVNVYFDNVGGAVLEAALANLALHARVVLCGLMDQYNDAIRPPGPNLAPVIGARATLMGLVVYDYFAELPLYLAQATVWIKARQLRWLEDIQVGIEATPEAFCRLMRGENVGKSLVKID
jgi:NADPH-dependent curcumin reductase CurA